MGNMSISHHQNIVSNTRLITFSTCPAYGYTLTENTAIADNRIGSFPLKFQILRNTADGSSREELAVFADGGERMYYNMRANNTAIPQHNVMLDYRIRTNYYIFSNFRAFFNDRSLMYLTQWCHYRCHFSLPLQQVFIRIRPVCLQKSFYFISISYIIHTHFKKYIPEITVFFAS